MVFLISAEITCKLSGTFNKMSECFWYRCEFELIHPLIPPSLILSPNLSFSMFSLMHLVIHILPVLSTIAFLVHCVITHTSQMCSLLSLLCYSSILRIGKNQSFEQYVND